MAQNIGTLVISPIRPNDSLDNISSAFANELKGGLHSVETLAERDAIYSSRREWSMWVAVYNDGVNNGVYELTYNENSTVLTDNLNWVKLSIGSVQTYTAGTNIDITNNVVSLIDNPNIAGNLTITGNLVVNGTTTTQNTETLLVTNNFIEANSGEVGAGVTAGTSGLNIDRGSETDFQILFDEADDKLKSGLVGSLLQIPNIQNTPLSTGVTIWDGSKLATIANFTHSGTQLLIPGVATYSSAPTITNPLDIPTKAYVDTVAGAGTLIAGDGIDISGGIVSLGGDNTVNSTNNIRVANELNNSFRFYSQVNNDYLFNGFTGNPIPWPTLGAYDSTNPTTTLSRFTVLPPSFGISQGLILQVPNSAKILASLGNNSKYEVTLGTGSTFEYTADYSSSFTSRSIVDKAYVDNAVSSASGGTPAGNNREIQFNDNGSFGASSSFRFTGSSNSVGAFYTGTVNPTNIANRMNYEGVFSVSRLLTPYIEVTASTGNGVYSTSNTGSAIYGLCTQSTGIGVRAQAGVGTPLYVLKTGSLTAGSGSNHVVNIQSDYFVPSTNITGNIINIVDNNTKTAIYTNTSKLLSAQIASTVRTVLNPRLGGSTGYLFDTHNALAGEKHTVFANQGTELVTIEETQTTINNTLKANSTFKAGKFTAAQATALTPEDGDFIYVTSTDVTFTSIGFWGYENGVWVKL